MLSGDNSILQRATDAKTNTDNAQIKERIQLAYHSALAGGQGSYTKEGLEEELEKEFGENNYNVDDSDNTNWILSAKGQDVTIPAGKKETNSSSTLSEEQLRTKIIGEDGDCMIDEDGNIMPITAWDYYIDAEPYYIAGYDDGEEFDSGYNGELNDDGTLQYNIPVFVKKSGNLYKITKFGSTSLSCWRTLKKVKIPNNITIIGEAFRECEQLENVDLPDNLTTIGFGAFGECKSLASISIPDSVKTIDTFAFGHCEKLSNINIPNGVTSIGNMAFSSCPLLSIDIPDSVVTMGENVFDSWTSSQVINIGFKENEIPSGWSSRWNNNCNAQINYAQ